MPGSDDRVELVRLLTRVQSTVQSYAYAIVRDFHAAEDVYQEVALVVAERWEEAPGEPERVLAWIREITRRKALEARRGRRRMPPTLSEGALVSLGDHFGAPDPGRQARSGLEAVLAACLRKLTATARRVVEARYSESVSCEDIAGRIGRSVQSVYSLLKRSRLALTECVERSLAAERGEAR